MSIDKIFYSGIGSRETPDIVCDFMTDLAEVLGNEHMILRSGGAIGADKAFEKGAVKSNTSPIIYNKHTLKNHNISYEAIELAKKYHPAWDKLNDYAKFLHIRNGFQVLGYDLKTISKFIICWTPGGRMIGGTSQALRIAHDYNIPVINLFNMKLDIDFIMNKITFHV